MKFALLLFITLAGLLVSCYKPYSTDIDTDKKVLVVSGLVTNEPNSYHIRLSYAVPFDSSYSDLPVHDAEVYITDDHGNYYTFHEWDNGDYMSDPEEFTGLPGSTYKLHILTPEGEQYESDPQHLFPEVYPDSVYAEYDYKETFDNATGLRVIRYGANILADIGNKADTLPRFRFTSNLVTQYFYVIQREFAPTIAYYCWQTENANSDINITGERYALNSVSIRNHAFCFIENTDQIFSRHYDTYTNEVPFQFHIVHNRIIYFKQYTLNYASHLFYKCMDEQLRSEGKLFDPIAVQLNGNIKCITNPEKKAFGFFETSSVSNSAYKVDFRNLVKMQPSVTRVPYILPPQPAGYSNDNPLPFWVN
jgi:hypothetical protein